MTERLETVAAAFRAGAQTYQAMGAPLYAALCANGSDKEDVIALASHAQEGAQPVFHLLASVHYLLLRDPADPLSRYFATLTDEPAPPQEAFPDFARFCAKYRQEILLLLASRTVQTTYAERCLAVMPPLSLIADKAGEPLNLVEIGCSAGVLLAFDKFAYDLQGRGRIGPVDAPLTFPLQVHGGPTLRIPTIGERVGLDLHPVDASSDEERRWLIALTFPEFRQERARLATALDAVARTSIRMLKGDALELLPGVLAATPSPLCVFHSACLYYWSDAAKAALEVLLTHASRGRDIYRVGVEGSAKFSSFHKGRAAAAEPPQSVAKKGGEVILTRYIDGAVDSRVVGYAASSLGTFEWID